MISLKLLPAIRDPQPPNLIKERSMWNPLMSGMFITYLTYFANLEGGSAMIDSFAQLRFVLHLCNALKQVGLLTERKLPLLDILERNFEESNAIWYSNTKPEQGEFVFRWWIAYGMKPDIAIQFADEIRELIENELFTRPSNDLLKYRSGNTIRKLTPINAEDYSKSFRRICLCDFLDAKDR